MTKKMINKSYFSGDHGVGEVPRGDHGCDADGLSDEDELLAVGGGGDDVAVDPARLLAEPLDEGVPVHDLPPGLRQWLPLLRRQQGGQVLCVADTQIVPGS